MCVCGGGCCGALHLMISGEESLVSRKRQEQSVMIEISVITKETLIVTWPSHIVGLGAHQPSRKQVLSINSANIWTMYFLSSGTGISIHCFYNTQSMILWCFSHTAILKRERQKKDRNQEREEGRKKERTWNWVSKEIRRNWEKRVIDDENMYCMKKFKQKKFI